MLMTNPLTLIWVNIICPAYRMRYFRTLHHYSSIGAALHPPLQWVCTILIGNYDPMQDAFPPHYTAQTPLALLTPLTPKTSLHLI